MSRLVLVAGLLFMATPATAMPRFSARKGLPCSACHVDPTGGGMRNDFGRDVFALTELPASDGASATPREPPPAALGADVRLRYMHLRKRAHIPIAKTSLCKSTYVSHTASALKYALLTSIKSNLFSLTPRRLSLHASE